MLRAVLILVLLLPSVVGAQPSATLERAIKLYDKRDYFSSSIEASRVIDDGSRDSPENVQHAKFFLAKSLYHLKFYVPSLAMVHALIEERGSRRGEALEWLAMLSRVLPEPFLYPSLRLVGEAELGDPARASVRDELHGLHARATAMPNEADLPALTRMALGCTHADIARTRALIAHLLGGGGGIALAQAAEQALDARDPERRTLAYVVAALVPAVGASRAWSDELGVELDLLQRSDTAWQTTRAAADVRHVLTSQQPVGLAEVGVQIERILPQLDAELASVTGETIAATPPESCHISTPSPSLAPGPPPVARSAHGCGCSTGGSPDGSLVIALLALAWGGRRHVPRKRKRGIEPLASDHPASEYAAISRFATLKSGPWSRGAGSRSGRHCRRAAP